MWCDHVISPRSAVVYTLVVTAPKVLSDSPELLECNLIGERENQASGEPGGLGHCGAYLVAQLRKFF